ncbi:MAG: acyl-CoA dehydrogenase family protein [Deltaproteobacteria bacterium]|nr:MAG: acyl-CoA dehydrogenase family protein [Deltaproteobacteria bacterium]
MIDFALADELRLIQQTAREFADAELRPRDREFERARGVPDDVRRRYDEIGLGRVELPESLGGAGLGALARVLILEELAAADAGAALALDPLGPALYPLREFGGDAALERFAAPLLARPGARAVLFWDARPRIREVDAVATGILPWVPSDRADLLVVLEKERAYAIAEGIRCEPLRGAGLRAAGASELHLERAPIVASWVHTPQAQRALARARLYAAALLVGVMRASADYSRAYAVERQAFGRPIAHHQALAFLITDMAAAVETARLLVLDAAWRLDRGEPAAEACASAFLEASEQSMFVTPNGVQILGGHGFMQDYPVEKYMREARALSLLFGGVDLARDDAGRDLVRSEGPVPLTVEA